MELNQFESKFNAFLEDLKSAQAPEVYWQRGYAMPKKITEDALLFVGLNPSFKKDAQLGSHLYSIEQNERGYYTKFNPIAKACGDDVKWHHFDLLPIRHTSQKNVERDVIFRHPGITNGYLHNVSKVILENLKPKAVVVVNATARLLLGKDQNEHAEQEKHKKIWMGYQFKFCESNGACYIENSAALKDVPFFFSGMLTGKGPLDTGSYERLKWHVAKVVKGN